MRGGVRVGPGAGRELARRRFIALTNHAAAHIGTAELSVLFLSAAFLAGLGHLNRCAWRAVQASGPGLVLVAWQVLLAFVTLRMGAALGLC